jgi:hypothetical protein
LLAWDAGSGGHREPRAGDVVQAVLGVLQHLLGWGVWRKPGLDIWRWALSVSRGAQGKAGWALQKVWGRRRTARRPVGHCCVKGTDGADQGQGAPVFL